MALWRDSLQFTHAMGGERIQGGTMTTNKLVAFLGASTLLLAVGCSSADKGTSSPKDQQAQDKVLTQAAFDLECEAGQLQIQKISDDHAMMGVKNATYGVRGCGRQATYKTSCGLGNCSIMKDGATGG